LQPEGGSRGGGGTKPARPVVAGDGWRWREMAGDGDGAVAPSDLPPSPAISRREIGADGDGALAPSGGGRGGAAAGCGARAGARPEARPAAWRGS